MQKLIKRFLRPFRDGGRIYRPLLLLYLLVNLLVLRNAVLHDPHIGYDAIGYLEYMQAAADGSLPTEEETEEYFSAPLAFVPGTLTYAALQPFADSPALNPPNDEALLSSWLYYNFLYSLDDFPLAVAGKVSQLLNVVYSLAVTWLLLKIAQRLRPGDLHFSATALFVLGMLPVYYKTFAMVRAEPLMLVFVMLGLYLLVRALTSEQPLSMHWVVGLGVVAGLGMLTRQWFVSAALLLWLGVLAAAYQRRLAWAQVLRLGAVFAIVAAAIALPFYLHLQRSAGSMAAFNLDSGDRELPYETIYYFTLIDDETFQDPVRNSAGFQFIPILYSETWGDYWAYFTVWGREIENGRYLYGLYLSSRLISPEQVASGELSFETNRFEINGYLARVNRVSLLPSALLLAATFWLFAALWRALRQHLRDPDGLAWAVLGLYVVLAAAVFLAFLAVYLPQNATTAKTSYVLHIFPVLALFAADLLGRLRARAPRLYAGLLVLLALVMLHNLPAMLSRQVL